MTLVMAYVILLSAAIGATTLVVETVLRRRGVAGRWHWLAALALTVGATVAAMVTPIRSGQRASPAVDFSGVPVREAAMTTAPVAATDASRVLAGADVLLPYAWLLGTALLLCAIIVGQRWLRRERRRARPTELAGEPVLLSDRIGPAVAGVRTPVVFIPRWVMALDDPSQRLLMAHEMEHVRERDTAMLFAAALTAALFPWNPVVWWMGRRLRLAVEQDCDARVLATHPGIRRYADLLLMAASRPGVTARLLAAHFGENSSDLVRRIDTMTSNGRIPWRRVAPATFVAGLLLGVACETPRPEPVAPVDLRSEVTSPPPAIVTADPVKETVIPLDGSAVELLKERSKRPGDSAHVAWTVELPEVRATRAQPLLVDESVTMNAVPPATMKEVRVAEVPDGSGRMSSANRVVIYRETAKATLRDWTSGSMEMPNIVVRSIGGEELFRFKADPTREYPVTAFNDLKPDDIAAIEVYKARSCAASLNVECPAIIVTVKKGREAAYRRK